jgi:hypothetical protein
MKKIEIIITRWEFNQYSGLEKKIQERFHIENGLQAERRYIQLKENDKDNHGWTDTNIQIMEIQ